MTVVFEYTGTSNLETAHSQCALNSAESHIIMSTITTTNVLMTNVCCLQAKRTPTLGK